MNKKDYCSQVRQQSVSQPGRRDRWSTRAEEELLAAKYNVPQQRSVWITPGYLKRNKGGNEGGNKSNHSVTQRGGRVGLRSTSHHQKPPFHTAGRAEQQIFRGLIILFSFSFSFSSSRRVLAFSYTGCIICALWFDLNPFFRHPPMRPTHVLQPRKWADLWPDSGRPCCRGPSQQMWLLRNCWDVFRPFQHPTACRAQAESRLGELDSWWEDTPESSPAHLTWAAALRRWRKKSKHAPVTRGSAELHLHNKEWTMNNLPAAFSVKWIGLFLELRMLKH